MLLDFKGGSYLWRRGKAFHGFSVYSLERQRKGIFQMVTHAL